MNVRHYIDLFAYKAFRSSYHHESIDFNYKEAKSLQSSRQGNKEGGFTLIELMIVIAIIGILAAVAIPNYISYRDKGYCNAAEVDAKNIVNALADYYSIPSHTRGLNGNLGPNGTNLTIDGKKFPALSPDNTATISGVIDAITISVTDGSGRCPDDYQQDSRSWDSNVFTIKML
jgi:prepilin-type N-terminal cleavage/methylation domain-containing protein